MPAATFARIGNRGGPALFQGPRVLLDSSRAGCAPFAQTPRGPLAERVAASVRQTCPIYPRGSSVVGRPRKTRASMRLSRVAFGESRYLLEELRNFLTVEATLGSRREVLGPSQEPRLRVPGHLGGGLRRPVQHLHQIVPSSCVVVFETSISSTAWPSKRPSRSGSPRRAGGGSGSPSCGRCSGWPRAWWPRSRRGAP